MKDTVLKQDSGYLPVLRWLLVGAIWLALGYKLQQLDAPFLAWLPAWWQALPYDRLWLLAVVLLLMPLNWAIEARKWQLLTAMTGRAAFMPSIRAVLSGLSMGFISPPALGDVLGRVMQSEQKQKLGLVGAVMASRLSQLGITLVMGLWSCWVFTWRYTEGAGPGRALWGTLALALLMLLVLLGVFAARQRLMHWCRRLGWRRPAAMLRRFGRYSGALLLQVMWLSALRYLVFSMQFVLILWLCDIDLPFTLMLAGVAWVFLIKSVVPGFHALQELGLRGLSSLIFFEGLVTPVAGVVWAGLLLWGINILVPAAAGALTLLRAKL